MTHYRLAGIVLETEWPLVTDLLPAPPGLEADLTFEVSLDPPGAHGIEPMQFEGVGDLWMLSDQEWVFHLTHPEHDYQVEVYLLGLCIALWHAQQGTTVLHGSAVTAGSHAVGFLGPNGTGKTSLALSLVDRGERLLTDDLLAAPVRDGVAWAEPTFPQVRLWPGLARHRLGNTDGLALAHPGYEKLRVPVAETSFSVEPAALSALYLPRRGGDVSFEEVIGPRALFSLMLEGFSVWFNDRPEQRPGWIASTAALLETVAVYTLTYPDDTEALPDVAQAIQRHSESLVQSKRVGDTAATNGA